jgi:hypothetical protein
MPADGKGQAGHVGGVPLRLLAERTGLTGALSVGGTGTAWLPSAV